MGENSSGLSKEMEEDSFDDHHRPLRPDDYLQFRVRPMLEVYKRRLPLYSRRKTVASVLIILGTISATVVAAANLSTWAAISTAVTGSLMSFVEFSGVEEKLVRYSEAVHRLQETMLTWRSKGLVDRSSITCVNELVEECENVFQTERSGWVHSASSSQQLAKKMAELQGESLEGDGKTQVKKND
jgi:hypothetical protein